MNAAASASPAELTTPRGATAGTSVAARSGVAPSALRFTPSGSSANYTTASTTSIMLSTRSPATSRTENPTAHEAAAGLFRPKATVSSGTLLTTGPRSVHSSSGNRPDASSAAIASTLDWGAA